MVLWEITGNMMATCKRLQPYKTLKIINLWRFICILPYYVFIFYFPMQYFQVLLKIAFSMFSYCQKLPDNQYSFPLTTKKENLPFLSPTAIPLTKKSTIIWNHMQTSELKMPSAGHSGINSTEIPVKTPIWKDNS